MHREVGVRHPDLATHAGVIAGVGDRVDTAAQAGRVVRVRSDAYGKLCAFVPMMLGSLQDTLADGIASAADSLQDTAARLRTTAQEYEAADQRARDRIP